MCHTVCTLMSCFKNEIFFEGNMLWHFLIYQSVPNNFYDGMRSGWEWLEKLGASLSYLFRCVSFMDIYLHITVKLRHRVLGHAWGLENNILLRTRENYSCEKSSARQEKQSPEHMLRGCWLFSKLPVEKNCLRVWVGSEVSGKKEWSEMTTARVLSAFMPKGHNAVCGNCSSDFIIKSYVPSSFYMLSWVILMDFTFFLGFTRNNNWTSSCGWTPWTSVIGNWKISFFPVLFYMHLESKFLWVNLVSRNVIFYWQSFCWQLHSGTWKEHQIFLISALPWNICEAWKRHIYSMF